MTNLGGFNGDFHPQLAQLCHLKVNVSWIPTRIQPRRMIIVPPLVESMQMMIFTFSCLQRVRESSPPKSRPPLGPSTYCSHQKFGWNPTCWAPASSCPNRFGAERWLLIGADKKCIPRSETAHQSEARAWKTAELLMRCKLTTFKPISRARNKITVEPLKKTIREEVGIN